LTKIGHHDSCVSCGLQSFIRLSACTGISIAFFRNYVNDNRRGIIITDLKPEHLILTSTGLYLVDYGCAYQVQRGRRVRLLYTDPVFSSRMEFTSFGNLVCIALSQFHCLFFTRDLRRTSSHWHSVFTTCVTKPSHG
jgi:hypothetical protein